MTRIGWRTWSAPSVAGLRRRRSGQEEEVLRQGQRRGDEQRTKKKRTMEMFEEPRDSIPEPSGERVLT